MPTWADGLPPAAALLAGFARKLTYIAAAVFSLRLWATTEGFGGPYIER